MTKESGECLCCRWDKAAVTEYQLDRISPFKADLCEVCATTFLSSSIEYPEFCKDDKLYKSLGRITNMLLHEIAELRKEIQSLKEDK